MAPVADAGSDQVIEAGSITTAFTLSASASSDPDGDVITYRWSDINGNLIGTEPTLELSRPVGNYDFVLEVTDSGGLSSYDTVTVKISHTNPPILELPTNLLQEADSNEGAVVTFSPAAYDVVDGVLQ